MAAGTAAAGFLLAAGSIGLFAYPFLTDVRAGRQQSALEASFGSTQFRDLFQEGRLAEGSPLTRLIIPKLGVDTIVVEGTSLKALEAGAGHYPGTPLPGQSGNVTIAGHRTMNGKPFAGLDRLAVGDEIQLATPMALHTYEVQSLPWVIAANDWSVTSQTSEALLTLTTCHPKGSDRQRLVVRSKLISTERV